MNKISEIEPGTSVCHFTLNRGLNRFWRAHTRRARYTPTHTHSHISCGVTSPRARVPRGVVLYNRTNPIRLENCKHYPIIYKRGDRATPSSYRRVYQVIAVSITSTCRQCSKFIEHYNIQSRLNSSHGHGPWSIMTIKIFLQMSSMVSDPAVPVNHKSLSLLKTLLNYIS